MPSETLHACLKHWLESTPGPWRIGQVAILPGYELRHAENLSKPAERLQLLFEWASVRELVREDKNRRFRPLKSAPSLRRGWRLTSLTVEELILAFQFIYPAALANWQRWLDGSLEVTPYEETAQRQSGRYHIIHRATEPQLEELTREVCAKSCLKRRLWGSGTVPPQAGATEISLLCPEVCNYFIGCMRAKLKGAAEEE